MSDEKLVDEAKCSVECDDCNPETCECSVGVGIDECRTELLELPSLNLLYAKLAMRMRRLDKISELISETDRTKLVQWELAQQVRRNEEDLVAEARVEISEVHKRIEEISVRLGQEMTKEMLPVVGEVLYELGLTEKTE
jgi:hypothetical protein